MGLSEKFQKLPDVCKPNHYKLRLSPDLEKFLAKGHVDISLTLSERSSSIKLHSAVHEFNSATLKLENGKELTNLKFELDKKWKTVSLQFPTEVDPQKAILSIEFVTEISEQMSGFYRSDYTDAHGKKKYMASTQFESDSARLAFPCWDEPVYKATFDIELEVDKNLTALSNMNVVSEIPAESDKKLVKFATTPLMSTYLVAFIVGEFEYVETTYGEKQIPIRVYTVPGKKEKARFSLDVAKKSMMFYDDWFQFCSPLPKVDLIAIPNFSMGAMENWGLITFREVRLLVDETTTSFIKAYSALVTAHEVAHFWFGNLVTMHWWNELWLKEGFATFMMYFFVHQKFPELNANIIFLSTCFTEALVLDGQRSSHTIEATIEDPKELTSIYDAITYHKSSSIIRMLCHYLGEESFREGLRIYIKRHQYSNATTMDLWKALSDASKQDIGKLMSCWTQQIGYPLITVEESRLPDGKRRLKLVQNRYLADGSTDDTLWQIPITLITSNHADQPFQRFLMSEREKVVEFDGIADDEWLKINPGTTGFYRVKYSDEMFARLVMAVQTGKLAVEDRYGLANDLFALVTAGKAPASQFLAFVVALKNETEHLVWHNVISGIHTLTNVLGRHDPELKQRFDKFTCSVLEPVAARLGWEVAKDEGSDRSKTRATILGALSKAGHEATIQQALKLFEQYAGGNTSAIHPELRSMIFRTASAHHPKGSELLLKVYESSDSSELQHTVLGAAIQTHNEEARRNLLDYAVLEKKVKSQDLMHLFIGAKDGSSKVQDHIWTWLKTNCDQLIKRFGKPDDIVFLRCFKFSGSGQSTEEFVHEFEAFFNDLDEDTRKALGRTVKETLETVRINKKLLDHKPSVEEFLSAH